MERYSEPESGCNLFLNLALFASYDKMNMVREMVIFKEHKISPFSVGIVLQKITE